MQTRFPQHYVIEKMEGGFYKVKDTRTNVLLEVSYFTKFAAEMAAERLNRKEGQKNGQANY